MGSKVYKPQVQGILVPAASIALETLDEANSTYSQAGANPGQPTSNLRTSKLSLEVSGGQETAIEVLVRQAGLPERDDFRTGLGVQWRPEGETLDHDWRGRNAPRHPHKWVPAVWGDSDSYDLGVCPVSQTAILLYVASNGENEGTSLLSRYYDHATGEWSEAITVAVDPDEPGDVAVRDWQWVAACPLPDDRMLAIAYGTPQPGGAFYTYVSDDRGRSWTKYAYADFLTDGSGDFGRAAYFRGQLVLFNADIGTGIHQKASRDLGTSWDRLLMDGTGNAPTVRSVSVAALAEDAGIIVGYIDDDDNFPRVTVLQSAYENFSLVETVRITASVDTTQYESLTIDVDGAGIVWACMQRLSGFTDWVDVYYSLDNGVTWVGTGQMFQHGTSTIPEIRLLNLVGKFCRGDLIVAHNASVPVTTTTQTNIGTLFTSGWSNVHVDAFGWGGTGGVGSAPVFHTGIPIEVPSNEQPPPVGRWSQGGTTPTVIASPGELEFAVVNGTSTQRIEPATDDPAVAFAVGFSLRIVEGSPDPSALNVGAFVRFGAPTFHSDLEVRFGVDTVVIADGNGGAEIATIENIDTTQWHEFIVAINPSRTVFAAYRRSTSTRWTIVLDRASFAVSANFVGGLDSAFEFGVFTDQTVEVRSRHWFVAEADLDEMFEVGREDTVGGTITTSKTALPGLGSDERAGFLSASRGPGVRNERFTARPFYTFGVENLFPQLSPSPARPWRSTDTSEQTIAFDVRSSTGEQDRHGPVWHHGVALIGCNFREAVVEYTRDGSLWLAANAAGTSGTWDAAAGFTGLAYDRRGHDGLVDTAWLRPSTGTAAGARVLARNELVGGHAVISGTAYRITANSPGVWSAAAAVGGLEVATTQLAEVRIEGSPPATGTVDLVWPSAVLWNRALNGNPALTNFLFPGFAQGVRLRIPANQPTVEGYYQIGAMVVGSTMVLGKRSSRGWVQAMEPNVSRRVSRRGTVRKRQLGPNRRRWTWNWGDGLVQKYARDGGTPDYLQLGPSELAGPAVALRDDVWTNLWGLLDELEGGAVPVVAAAALPLTGDGTQTDRTLFLYSTVDSAIQFTEVQGDEGDSEFGRVDPLRLTELV